MIELPFFRAKTERFGEILIPLVPVALKGPRATVKALMLLDSGADITMIPYALGKTLGLKLDMSARSEVEGIGEGSVPYVLARVKIQIERLTASARVGWALIEEVPLILGRLDVFSALAVEFRQFENKIILKRPKE